MIPPSPSNKQLVVGDVFAIVGAALAIVGPALAIVGVSTVSAFLTILSVVALVGSTAAGQRLLGALRALLSGVSWRGSRHVPVAVHGMAEGIGWRVMRVAARMMPPATGRRWLAEADSFLAEAPPPLRRAAVASYVAGAAQVIAVSWTGELGRLTRRGTASR